MSLYSACPPEAAPGLISGLWERERQRERESMASVNTPTPHADLIIQTGAEYLVDFHSCFSCFLSPILLCFIIFYLLPFGVFLLFVLISN